MNVYRGEVRQTRVRYLIIAILFALSCFSYGDRVALSLAGAAMGKAIPLDPDEDGLSLLRIQLDLWSESAKSISRIKT